MQLLPAIDLLDGKCVRLLKGDFNRCEVYPVKPDELAAKYAFAGATWLHVVDLAASRDGEKADSTPLYQLISQCTQLVQTGGGVRNADDVATRLDNGAGRVVVGSISTADPPRFSRWLRRFGAEKLVAALDVLFNEKGIPIVRTHGWTRDSGRSLWELLEYYEGKGLEHVLCTDISRDGAMSGPNVSLYRDLKQQHPEFNLQASGGVSNLNDLLSLATTGADQAISGKALLDGSFTASDAVEALK